MGWFSSAANKIKKAAKKLGKKVVQTLKKVWRVAQELAWRAASIFDFFGSLLNIQPAKHARLKVFVLFDEADPAQTLVVPVAEVERWVTVAANIFKKETNITLHPHGGDKGHFVHTLGAPAFVLVGPPCGFKAGFRDRSDWFEEHTSDTFFGYGGTLYAFVVKTLDVKSKTDQSGCAWPWIHNFCLVDGNKPTSTVLAHEMGHLFGLFPHSTAAQNLMNASPAETDTKLNRLQESVVRTARYATYIDARL